MDLNHRPIAYRATALPTELSRCKLGAEPGIRTLIYWVEASYSTIELVLQISEVKD